MFQHIDLNSETTHEEEIIKFKHSEKIIRSFAEKLKIKSDVKDVLLKKNKRRKVEIKLNKASLQNRVRSLMSDCEKRNELNLQRSIATKNKSKKKNSSSLFLYRERRTTLIRYCQIQFYSLSRNAFLNEKASIKNYWTWQ